MKTEKATREHISFKPNKRDQKIYDYFLKMSEVYGKSGYVKHLIEQDMKENENAENE